MKILLTALELSPYLERSSAASTVANLAKALSLLGHELTIASPYFDDYEKAGLLLARRLTSLDLGEDQSAQIFDVQLSSGVCVSLLRAEHALFDSNQPLEGQAAALGAFAKAAAAYAIASQEAACPFDVVHAVGACAGLCLLHLRAKGMAKVLSVHDASCSGDFQRGDGKLLAIPEDRLGSHGFGSGNGLSLLKGLLSEADAVLSPSATYGNNLSAPEHYGALARAFQGIELQAIVGGIDVSVYNPSTDSALTSRYDAPDPSNKGRNKIAVLSRLGLEFEPARPLLLIENVEQGDCGWATLFAAIPGLIRNQVALAILAPDSVVGDARAMLEQFDGQASVVSQASDAERRELLAGSDFYLSLQRRAPLGRPLLEAGRYGSIPIALRTDAACDVVVDCDAELKTGTGLLYESMTQRALIAAAGRAIAVYHHADYPRLLRRVMRADVAWDRPARRHVQVYRQVCAQSGAG